MRPNPVRGRQTVPSDLELPDWQLGDDIPDAETDAELATLLRAIGDHLSLGCVTRAADRISRLEALVARQREALEPFAKAAAGVAAFDPDFPMEGAALRAAFDWYDKAQAEPLKRHSVRRADLERARAALEDQTNAG